MVGVLILKKLELKKRLQMPIFVIYIYRRRHHLRIQLSDHFNYTKLLRFSLPSIIMTVIVSTYGILDGLLVSKFGGKTSFAAISLILPFNGQFIKCIQNSDIIK